MAAGHVVSDKCVILTVGIKVNGDRTELVMPCGVQTAAAADHSQLCVDAVTSFNAVALAALLDCLSSDAEVTFVQAVGMVNGFIPHRTDFAPGTHMGTRASDPAPSTVGALISYYADPAYPKLPSHRVRVPKNIVCGIAKVDLAGDGIVVALNNALVVLQNTFITGYASFLYVMDKWFRVSGIARATGTNIPCCVSGAVRGYIGTQRRRDIPH